MIVFSDTLYVGESVTERADAVRRELSAGERVRGIYVCYVNENTGREEAMKSELIAQDYFREKTLKVTALLGNRGEMELYLLIRAAENAETGDAIPAPDADKENGGAQEG